MVTEPSPAGESAADILGEFIDGSHDLVPWLVPAYARLFARRLGALDMEMLLQDYGQKLLIPLTDEAHGEALTRARSIDDSLPGRAYMSMAPVQAQEEAGVCLCVPLLDGADRIGVLELLLPHVDDGTLRLWERYAALLTDLVVSKGAHTDVYFRARRRREMNLAAEMQWHLLPPLTVRDQRVALGACLEPAYEVGGDAFDYAINHDIAHLAIFDAMGHGLDAAVMAGVAVGAYRHARRAGVPVADMYALIDRDFAGEFDADRFVTAQLANLHLPSGMLDLVNAGHPAPLHVRGRRVMAPVEGPATLPIGLGGSAPRVITTQLEPGDRVLFYSDGVVEARRGEQGFGEERLVDTLERVMVDDLPLAEIVRRVSIQVAEWAGSRAGDDATLLLVEWRGGKLRLPGISEVTA